MSEQNTPSRHQHSISYHINISNSKSQLPKVASFHSKTPDISDSTFSQKHKKSLNFLEFPSLFAGKSTCNLMGENSVYDSNLKKVFLTDVSKNFNDLLKLCNQSIFSKPSQNKEKIILKTPKKINEVSKNTFNELRKKTFRIGNLLDENLQIPRKNGVNKGPNDHFHKKSKLVESEKKANEIHIKKIIRGREKHLEFSYSPEKEKEFFDKLKHDNLVRIVQIHNNKLLSIKKYAGLVEKETEFDNKNFKGLYNAFTKEFEAFLKK